MSHIDLHHHVTVEITSTDTQLLDDLEAELPTDDAEIAQLSLLTGPMEARL